MMMYEITEHKLDKMSGYVEEMLHAGGRLMSCIEELHYGALGHKGMDGYDRYGTHHLDMPYRGSIHYRDDMPHHDREWEDGEMGERRRRRSASGRYM